MFVTYIKEYPFVLAFILGLLPALIWMWFWLKEDIHPEPHKILTLSFLGGMLAVVLVLPVQRFIYDYVSGSGTLSFFLWASLEEIFKFVMVYTIALRNRANDEPVDNMIYLIVSALGFVCMENTLFLVDTVHNGDFIATIITDNLRFIGASLLHIISSGTIGIFIGLSFYKSPMMKRIYFGIGLVCAIALHTTFNLLIIQESSAHIFLVFGAVWVGIITLLLLFEKVKNITPNI